MRKSSDIERGDYESGKMQIHPYACDTKEWKRAFHSRSALTRLGWLRRRQRLRVSARSPLLGWLFITRARFCLKLGKEAFATHMLRANWCRQPVVFLAADRADSHREASHHNSALVLGVYASAKFGNSGAWISK